MQMDGWVDYLHVSWHGEHVLFPTLHLHSFPHFVVASLFIIFLCLLERSVIRTSMRIQITVGLAISVIERLHSVVEGLSLSRSQRNGVLSLRFGTREQEGQHGQLASTGW